MDRQTYEASITRGVGVARVGRTLLSDAFGVGVEADFECCSRSLWKLLSVLVCYFS